MNIFKKDVIINNAIEKFGEDIQLFVACEEMGELIQALSKYVRSKDKGKKHYEYTKIQFSILEEIADVEIMLAQLKVIFDDSDYEDIYSMKLKRLEERLRQV